MSVLKKRTEMELLSHLRAGSGKGQEAVGADAFQGVQRGMFVSYDHNVIEQATRELGLVSQTLGTLEFDGEEQQRAQQDLSGQDSLVQAFATALRTFDRAQGETGILPGPFVELPVKRGLLSCMETEAGQIKVRGIEGLLLTESYSWVLINNTLSHVKALVKGANIGADREALLTLWGPFLSLVSKELDQMKEQKGAVREKKEEPEVAPDCAEQVGHLFIQGKSSEGR